MTCTHGNFDEFNRCGHCGAMVWEPGLGELSSDQRSTVQISEAPDGFLIVMRSATYIPRSALAALQEKFEEGSEDGEKKRLTEMMRDPRYWRDRDPEMIKNVTDGFKKLYPA